jgi:hypothetical protein
VEGFSAINYANARHKILRTNSELPTPFIDIDQAQVREKVSAERERTETVISISARQLCYAVGIIPRRGDAIGQLGIGRKLLPGSRF